MLDCPDSQRLWTGCLTAAGRYRESLDKQISLITRHDLGFVQLEREIKTARRHLGLAKSALINHHRFHRCAEAVS
jgi:hypothetical protein